MDRRTDTWLQRYWRPLLALAYIAIILFDFIIAPIGWSVLQALAAGTVTMQWTPLTLTGAGIFHAAMGGVLGISAFSRGKEKIAKIKLEEIQEEKGR